MPKIGPLRPYDLSPLQVLFGDLKCIHQSLATSKQPCGFQDVQQLLMAAGFPSAITVVRMSRRSALSAKLYRHATGKQPSKHRGDKPPPLTIKQRRAVDLLGSMTAAQMAAEMRISPRVAYSLIARVRKKLPDEMAGKLRSHESWGWTQKKIDAEFAEFFRNSLKREFDKKIHGWIAGGVATSDEASGWGPSELARKFRPGAANAEFAWLRVGIGKTPIYKNIIEPVVKQGRDRRIG